MALPNWPSYAPIVAENIQLGFTNNVRRTGFDDGMIRQARIYTNPTSYRSVQIGRMTQAEYNQFVTWLTINATSGFNFFNPDTGGYVESRVKGDIGGVRFEHKIHPSNEPYWVGNCIIETL